MDRTTPIGLYNFGVAYLDTARAALPSVDTICFYDPFDFLCAHGLELIFKAELARTMDINDVRRRYGHNLLKLKKKLGQGFLSKFPINAELENTIEFLSIGHSGPNYPNRYLVTGTKQVLLPNQYLPTLSNFNTDDRRWLTSHFVKAIR